jgi:hypothetical protein
MENQQKEMSKEEMAERKAKLTQFYKEQAEFLKVQLVYETLVADIEDQRARATFAQAKIAQMLAGPSQEEPSNPEE